MPYGVPVRYPSGVSTDLKEGPLNMLGIPHPFQPHVFADDFDVAPDSGRYTTTVTTAGTVAQTAGDGGLVLLTTNASTPLVSDIAAIQLLVAGFKLVAGYRAWFMTRLQVSSAASAAFNVGLIQKTATPFTVTDGIYIGKATGSAANLTAYHVIGSVVSSSVVIPTGAYTLADNTNIDLALAVTRTGEVEVYVNANMVGVPPTGTGAVNAAGIPISPATGPCARLTPAALTTANLVPTLALQSGTASSKTMTADFLLAAKER